MTHQTTYDPEETTADDMLQSEWGFLDAAERPNIIENSTAARAAFPCTQSGLASSCAMRLCGLKVGCPQGRGVCPQFPDTSPRHVAAPRSCALYLRGVESLALCRKLQHAKSTRMAFAFRAQCQAREGHGISLESDSVASTSALTRTLASEGNDRH